MTFFRGGEHRGLRKSFREVFDYLYEGERVDRIPGARGLAREDRVAWISSRNIPRCANLTNWRMAARHFETLHGATQRPVYHMGIALEPGEHLSRQQWEMSVDRLMEGLGLIDHRALVVGRKDTAHEHVHVVVHRVDVLTDRIWQPSFDGWRSAVVLRELEREFGLRRLGQGAAQ